MKKYILILIAVVFYNTATSQVLYSENFDNFTLGNLGTDPTGVIPGQGGWLTENRLQSTQTNSFYTIVPEQNKGKVLDITAQSDYENLVASRKNLNTLVDKRTPGNDVIKFELDYFTGSKQVAVSGNSSEIVLVCDKNYLGHRWILITYHFEKSNGKFNADSAGNYDGEYNGITKEDLPFNTWVTFIAYLDYTNKKVYLEIPYLNKVFAADFLKNFTSTNLIDDFKPSTVTLYAGVGTSPSYPAPRVTRNRYDNIRLTALKEVPPEIIALSTTEFFNKKFNVFPNPATNVVNITNAENMLVNQVTVYDIAGKEIKNQTYTNETQIQLSIESLASGTYMLHLQTNEGLAVKKFIKK